MVYIHKIFDIFQHILFSEMTSKQVSDSNTQQINDLHRLIKKYHAIRNIVKILTVIIIRDNIYRIYEHKSMHSWCLYKGANVFSGSLCKSGTPKLGINRTAISFGDISGIFRLPNGVFWGPFVKRWKKLIQIFLLQLSLSRKGQTFATQFVFGNLRMTFLKWDSLYK